MVASCSVCQSFGCVVRYGCPVSIHGCPVFIYGVLCLYMGPVLCRVPCVYVSVCLLYNYDSDEYYDYDYGGVDDF